MFFCEKIDQLRNNRSAENHQEKSCYFTIKTKYEEKKQTNQMALKSELHGTLETEENCYTQVLLHIW